MTCTTLLILSIITVLIGIFIAKYWIELMIISLILKSIFYLLALSGILSFIWTLIINDTNSWLKAWIFFFILYSTIIAVYAFIIFDGARKFIDLIRYILKIK
jgi:hypothetical protein